MIQEELLKRNKDIALMLGWKETSAHKRDQYGYYQCVLGYSTPYRNTRDVQAVEYQYDKNAFAVEDLQFHSDWNWLMEAVKFIEGKDYWVEIVKSQLGTKTRNYPIIWCEIGKENSTDLLDDNCYTKITRGESVNRNKKEAVFIAVSDFAKLYNEGKL
jgi:hypothetical protein